MDDLISRQAAIDAARDWYEGLICGSFKGLEKRLRALPSAQSERKDTIEKDVAVEAISDELMSRFDISATYAYEVAETAVNRIEMMSKEVGRKASRNDSD